MEQERIRYYQTGSFAVGNRLLDPDQRAVQSGAQRANAHHLRPSRLPGLRRGPRRPVRAGRGARRQRRGPDRRQRDGLPGGLLDPVSRELVAAAVDPLAVRQCARRRDRDRRSAEGQGQRPHARRRTGRRRGHGRHRLRLPVGDVRAQRRRALHLLRQRGLHEHGRAALGRYAAGGPHRDHPGRGAGARRAVGAGQERAADRARARDPVRRDGDDRRSARSGGQGPSCDGAPRCPLHPHPRHLPAGLGHAVGGFDRDRAPGDRERALPGLGGR